MSCCSSPSPPAAFLPPLTRRSLLLSTATSLSLPSSPPPPPPPDTTVTDRVFMEFSLCPNYFRPDRSTLFSDSLSLSTLCNSTPDPDSPFLLGRVVLGLFGRLAPATASNFRSLCLPSPSSPSYKNTLVHKIFPGHFILAGRQGPKPGEISRPIPLPANTDALRPDAFLLPHSRPGLLSLCLSENDDDDEIRLDPDYRNAQFLITAGPSPDLDRKNIVFGSVLEGLDVVTAIAALPTYRPAERIRQFNDFAEFLGDERALTARASWNRPLKTVYISDCGEVQVAKPSLTPSLP